MRKAAHHTSLPGRRLCRRGAVALFFTLLFPPVALGTLALVIDIGSFYVTKAWLQAIADTAVLTGAASLDADQSFAQQDLQVRAIVTQTAQANGLDPAVFTVITTAGADDRLLAVTANVAFPAPTFFLAALGLDRGTIGIHATAEVTPGQAPLPQRTHLTE